MDRSGPTETQGGAPARRIELWHLCDSDRVFASSPYLRISTFPQLGLLYLAAVLRRRGFDVVYRDRAYDRLDRLAVQRVAREEPCAWLGLYGNIALRDDVVEAIGWARDAAPDVPILVGGPGHFEAEQYFRAGATAVVAGEADLVVGEIAARLAEGRPLDGVPGVRLPGRAGETGFAPLPDDLDALPRPAWDLAPPGRFRNDLAFIQRDPWYVMFASRGCPFHCAFCSRNHAPGTRDYRLRAPAAVVEEMRDLNRAHGVRHVKFQDDAFGGRREWLAEFCREACAAGLDVTWNCSSNPGLFRRDAEATLREMRRAGCTSVHFGLQSSSPAILSAIGRNPREPQWLAELVPLARKAGLYTLVDLIVGLPGETRETIEEHRRYARRLPAHMVQVFPLQVVPGTELARRYPDGKVTELPLEAIHQGVRRIHRGFLARPSVWADNLGFVLRHDPRRLLKLLRLVPFLLRFLAGFYRMAIWRGPTPSRVP